MPPLRQQRAGDAQRAVVTSAEVTNDPLDVAAARAAVAAPGAGAVVVFEGVVRDHDHGRDVTMIEYEGHPSAAEVMRAAIAAVVADHPELTGLVVQHRLGPLGIGESALVVAAAAPHRAQAFSGCAAAVDEIKRVLPVWKRQVFTDGTDEWVNCP